MSTIDKVRVGHTAGPWHQDCDGASLPIILGPHPKDGFVAFVKDADYEPERIEANARLIAAAPEMLEALETIAKIGGV